MKKTFTLFFTLLFINLFGQVDITFQVDMSGQTISTDGVHVAGNFNGWNTSSHTLTDQGGDIYAVTISLTPADDYEYKFLNGNVWGTEETPPGACSVGGNNRIFTAPSVDMTLSMVPFGGCPSPNPTQTVTFTVSMEGLPISPNGVHVVGNFNGWTPDGTMMTLLSDDFYQVTLPVLSSITTLQYKYLNGNSWGLEETVPAPCANANSNRESLLEGAGNTVELPVYEFETCNEVPLVLPVELTFFKAREKSNGIELYWQTATEENNLGFQVESSLDGKNWVDLDFVEGNKTTSIIQNYNYLDWRSFEGINYYRLKQIDFDGQFEYSNIVSVDVKFKKPTIVAYPNPVKNNLTVLNATGELTLYNYLGKAVKTFKITDDTFVIDMSVYENGIYLLAINQSNRSPILKTITKQ